jgi:uncharacterized protein (PEP-CTERM system associated)
VALLACGAMSLASALPRAARAQALLPATGADVRLGDLRQQYERAFQSEPPASTPGWSFTPALDVLLGWTDAIQGTTTGRTRSDFYTIISPSLAIQGQSQRVTASVFIAPQLKRYLATRSQDSTGLNFNGQSHVTLVPEMLFVDLRGASFMQSQTGGYGPAGTVNLGRQGEVQSTNFSISPYLQHRFGGYGMGEIGYMLGYNSITGANRRLTSPFQPPVTNQNTITRGWHVSFASGENLGRFNLAAQVLHNQSTGTGSLNGAHRNTESVTLGYAVTRTIQVNGTIGHEDLQYIGATPFRFNGLTWNVGLKLQPNPDSSISIGYGSHDGRNSAALDASYAPTARIRISAKYSEGITTGQEELAQALAGSDVNGFGQSIDHQTGIPLSVGNNFLGSQTAPARVKRFSAVITLLRDRDVYSLNLLHSDTQYVAAVSGPAVGSAISSTASSVGLAWQHSFSEAFNGNVYAQYGTRESGAPTRVTQQTVSASLGLSYAFSQTLSGRAQYSYSGTIGGGNALVPSYQQNLITVGLHKSF